MVSCMASSGQGFPAPGIFPRVSRGGKWFENVSVTRSADHGGPHDWNAKKNPPKPRGPPLRRESARCVPRTGSVGTRRAGGTVGRVGTQDRTRPGRKPASAREEEDVPASDDCPGGGWTAERNGTRRRIIRQPPELSRRELVAAHPAATRHHPANGRKTSAWRARTYPC